MFNTNEIKNPFTLAVSGANSIVSVVGLVAQSVVGLYVLTTLVLRVHALGALVLIRSGFGEKFLSVPLFILAMFLFTGYGAFSDAAYWYGTVFFGVGIYRMAETSRRRRSGEQLDTSDDGTPASAWLLLTSNEYATRQVLEPLLLIGVAVWLGILEVAFGLFFVIAAIGVAWETATAYARGTRVDRQAVDHLVQASGAKTAHNTQTAQHRHPALVESAFVTHARTARSTLSVHEMYRHLDPAIASMIEPRGGERSETQPPLRITPDDDAPAAEATNSKEV